MFESIRVPSSYVLDYYSPLKKEAIGVISIPHSGEEVPKEFHQYLSGDVVAYNEDVDYKVGELIDIEMLRKLGVAIIISKIHRVAVDLNRPEETAVLFWEENTKGVKIRTSIVDAEKKEEMLQKYHRPYYSFLSSLLRELEQNNSNLSSSTTPIKRVSFVDLHSMPSHPTEYHLKLNPNQKMNRADFCISDLKGVTCVEEYINFIYEKLRNLSYKPVINDPYFGGNITKYFGYAGVGNFNTNTIQIEINRSIYMNEDKKTLNHGYANNLKNNLSNSLSELFTQFQ
ncbi:MAG: N-formylglutamate amidohydrolase [Oligoflexia bacterium]|nr:N-formylglutamate amidohydrolase [Oligoflexia bacterium]